MNAPEPQWKRRLAAFLLESIDQRRLTTGGYTRFRSPRLLNGAAPYPYPQMPQNNPDRP